MCDLQKVTEYVDIYSLGLFQKLSSNVLIPLHHRNNIQSESLTLRGVL